MLSVGLLWFAVYSTSPTLSPHLRISMASTFDADSCDLASVTVLPTEEKSRSDCAELAEIANARRATVDSIGLSLDCSRHCLKVNYPLMEY